MKRGCRGGVEGNTCFVRGKGAGVVCHPPTATFPVPPFGHGARDLHAVGGEDGGEDGGGGWGGGFPTSFGPGLEGRGRWQDSMKSSMERRPTRAPSMAMSKKTIGLLRARGPPGSGVGVGEERPPPPPPNPGEGGAWVTPPPPFLPPPWGGGRQTAEPEQHSTERIRGHGVSPSMTPPTFVLRSFREATPLQCRRHPPVTGDRQKRIYAGLGEKYATPGNRGRTPSIAQTAN